MSIQALASHLQSTLAASIPIPLDGAALKRIPETVEHFVNELQRANPGKAVDPQKVLEYSYASMSKWLKGRAPPRQYQQPQQSVMPLTQFSIDKSEESSEMDPDAAFAAIMSARSKQLDQAPRAPSAPSSSSDTLMPLDLLSRRPPENFRKPAPDTVQQKDVIIPQEDTVKYRDLEYNLILNSKDRDWLNNPKENRYHFTVQFRARTEQVRTVTNSAGVKQLRRDMGAPTQLTVVNRLQNIKRLEFVKAIVPNEGLRVTVPLDSTTETPTPAPGSAFTSILSLPSVTVIVDELQGNNTGTNTDMDKALAVCQYDATWRSESNFSTYGINRGFALIIPKFMKAQREYDPTPLANLQTMTIRLLDPESNSLSTQPDCAMVSAIVFGGQITAPIPTSIYATNISTTAPAYIFIQTPTWFPMWAFSQMDKIWFQGLSFSPAIDGADDLITWLQDTAGQIIVGIAHTTEGNDVQDGPNAAGYANWIIIRNRFQDPSTGSVLLDPFTSDEAAFYEAINGRTLASGGLINLSRQVQVTLRAVVRGMDTTTLVRPDNV